MRARRFQMILCGAVVVAKAALLVADRQEGASPTAQGLFEDSLRGKIVELRQPLYSVLSVLRRNMAPVPRGITTLSPEKGTFFRIVEIGPFLDVSDSDANRVFDQVAAKKEAAGLPAPRLLVYKVGTRMKVRGFDWGVAILEVQLDDEFADVGLRSQSAPATTLRVMWPTPFSSDFRERTAVETLLGHAFVAQ